MRYRRIRVPGGTYFFTVNLLHRDTTLLTDHVDDLRLAIHQVKRKHPFYIDAMVVLPDHLHALWTLPEHEADFSIRWRMIKSAFSRSLPKTEHIRASRRSKGERGIWQPRFWEHWIRDEMDFNRHVDYIHINPVKHGYVDRAAAWPYSSIHKFIKAGMIDECWGCSDSFEAMAFGEGADKAHSG